MTKPKLVVKVTNAIKRQASSIASRVRKKRKGRSDTGSTISVGLCSCITSSNYRFSTVEDIKDKDNMP